MQRAARISLKHTLTVCEDLRRNDPRHFDSTSLKPLVSLREP